MWRTSPLVARKWKFAMKIVKNWIKRCQYCDDYQSILSDVDKHQRTCASNPNKDQTLNIDEYFDEQKFLQKFGGNETPVLDQANSMSVVEESKEKRASIVKEQSSDSSKTVTKRINKLDLNKYTRDDEFDAEERKQRPSDLRRSESSEEDDISKKLPVIDVKK